MEVSTPKAFSDVELPFSPNEHNLNSWADVVQNPIHIQPESASMPHGRLIQLRPVNGSWAERQEMQFAPGEVHNSILEASSSRCLASRQPRMASRKAVGDRVQPASRAAVNGPLQSEGGRQTSWQRDSSRADHVGGPSFDSSPNLTNQLLANDSSVKDAAALSLGSTALDVGAGGWNDAGPPTQPLQWNTNASSKSLVSSHYRAQSHDMPSGLQSRPTLSHHQQQALPTSEVISGTLQSLCRCTSHAIF